MPRSPLAPIVILVGIVLILLGLLLWSGALSWFGRLPGDVRVERSNVRIYIPIVSMLLLSLLLSAVLAIVRRFW